MKAIVLEIKEDWAAVLTDEGEFRKLRDQGWQVGQQLSEAEISLAESGELSGDGELPTFANAVKGHIWKKQLRTAIAAALVVAVLGAGGWTYTGVYAADSTVTVEVEDTSVEYTLNRRGEVISLRGLNESGEEYVASVGGEKPDKRRPLEDAIGEMMESLKSEGKIGDYKSDDDEDYMVVGISSRNEKRRAAISEKIQNAPLSSEGNRLKLFLLDDDPDDDSDFTGNIDEMLEKAGGPSRAERDARREEAVKAVEAEKDTEGKAEQGSVKPEGNTAKPAAPSDSANPQAEGNAAPAQDGQNTPAEGAGEAQAPQGEAQQTPQREAQAPQAGEQGSASGEMPARPETAQQNDAEGAGLPDGQGSPSGEPGAINGSDPDERYTENNDTDNAMLSGGAGTLPDDVPQQEGAGSEQGQVDWNRGQVPSGGEPGGMPDSGGHGGNGNPPKGMAFPGHRELHTGQGAGGAYVPVYGLAA